MVDVHLTNGRTVFRLKRRGQLYDLFNRDPLDENERPSVRAWALWFPGQTEWEPVRLQYIKRHSISHIVQVEPTERQSFEDQHAETGAVA